MTGVNSRSEERHRTFGRYPRDGQRGQSQGGVTGNESPWWVLPKEVRRERVTRVGLETPRTDTRRGGMCSPKYGGGGPSEGTSGSTPTGTRETGGVSRRECDEEGKYPPRLRSGKLIPDRDQ